MSGAPVFIPSDDGTLHHCDIPARWEQCEDHTTDTHDCFTVICNKCQIESCDADWQDSPE